MAKSGQGPESLHCLRKPIKWILHIREDTCMTAIIDMTAEILDSGAIPVRWKLP